jgi:hypothetical protein
MVGDTPFYMAILFIIIYIEFKTYKYYYHIIAMKPHDNIGISAHTFHFLPHQ